MDNRFPADCRLKNKKDIQAVFARREVFRGERLVFYKGVSSARPGNFSRFCLTVSKNCGIAVRRNRIKRVLREIIRKNRGQIEPGYDIIIRVDADRLKEKITEKDFLADFERYFGWH